MAHQRVNLSRPRPTPQNLNKNSSHNRVAVQMKILKNRQTIQIHSKTITITMEIIEKMENHVVTVIKRMAVVEAAVAAATVAVAVVEVALATIKQRKLSMK